MGQEVSQAGVDAQVIVVGGGPSGAMAARQLALAGVDTLLIEKAIFPRVKPCGGGLSAKVKGLLSPELWPQVASCLRGAVVFLTEGAEPLAIEAKDGLLLGWVVKRAEMDQRLLAAAQGAGVRVTTGEEVLGLEKERRGLTVRTSCGIYRAQWVVGADGVRSSVGRWLRGGDPPWERIPALVADVDAGGAPAGMEEGWSIWDFTAVPWGYGWVFPREDGLSVGIASMRRVPGLVSHFWSFVGARVAEARREGISPMGHLVPKGGRSSRVWGRGVILVGDAAGLADPFHGEGIPSAIESGIVAGDCLAKVLRGDAADPSAYGRWVRRLVDIPFRFGRVLAWMFYRDPGAVDRLVRASPGALLWIQRWMAGSVSYQGLMWVLLKRLPRLLRRLRS